MIEIESYALYLILQNQDLELFTKVKEEYFIGYNLVVFKKLNSYFAANQKLPTFDELDQIPKPDPLQNYIINVIKEEKHAEIQIDKLFLVRQLDDNHQKRKVLDHMEEVLKNYDTLEASEVRESIDSLSLSLNSTNNNADEFFDAASVELFSEDEAFILYPTGLSNEYDSVNGGFALQELVLLGGRRGSGKSIITLNALRARYEMGHTVALFSIEMRYKEQHCRLMSQVSGVPFLSIYKNELSIHDRLKLAESRVLFWYKNTEAAQALIRKVHADRNFKEFEVLCDKLEKKDNRFFIIDQINLDLPKLNYYLRKISSEYPKFTMAGVDYLNIVKIENRLDWKSQIIVSDTIKEYARTYNITAISPYQMDADGEARFAKGILDSADRSLIFMPQDQQDQQKEVGQLSELKLYTAKVRNGKPIAVVLYMDWATVSVVPGGRLVNEELIPAEKYRSDTSLIRRSEAMDLLPS